MTSESSNRPVGRSSSVDGSMPAALALLEAASGPMLLLDEDLMVLGASGSFLEMFTIDAAAIRGAAFVEIDGGRWSKPQLQTLLAISLRGRAQVGAYDFDLPDREHGVRHLTIEARALKSGVVGSARLLLSVTDVTDYRLNEALLRQNSILLEEVQHRIANSLQIIASVLMQGASAVQSEEARVHLHNAHHRVMSVAVLQQQLSASKTDSVQLREYLHQLCDSIGASMIRDPEQIKLTVDVDATLVKGAVSVSLGLIVTELVINALKHAFPEHHRGNIAVTYKGESDDWRLTVKDDGVGMGTPAHLAKSGLGTIIVESLAKQLRAHVRVEDAKPGCTVVIIHARPVAGNDPGFADPDLAAV